MAQKHIISDTEYPMTRMGTIQQPSRRYRRLRHPSFTAAIWTANNPLLQRGELGAEIDTGKLKVGDGVTYWNDLGYVAASEIAFADITGSPEDNVALKDALDAKQDVLTAGSNIDITDNTISATDTTYTGSDGITLTGTNFTNSGVRSVASGSANGTISVNTNGTSADVAVYGLGSAAYTSSSDYATAAQGALADTAVQPGDLATVATTGAFSDLTGKPTTLSGYGITDGANTDLSNLTSTGANIGNWSSNVTNCITEIPQDIKLELSSGTLTLKSGSKVYFGNGSSYTLTTDTTRSGGGSGSEMIVFLKNSKAIRDMAIGNCKSGSTQPTGVIYCVWFDTANNIIKYTSDGFSTWEECSFPVALTTFTSNVPTSIDQIFNGIGYISSTVFALPGVKGLTPNGRNADGTLNNTKWEVNSVLTTSVGSNVVIGVCGNAMGSSGSYIYDEEKNQNLNSGNYWNVTVIGKILSDGTIVLKNTTFHAVDYSDSEYIAHCTMPSSKYVDLTLPASGGTVTAPADGYYFVDKSSTAAAQNISLINLTAADLRNISFAVASDETICCIMPVSKNDSVKIYYGLGGATNTFRFIYANGAK